METSPPPPVYRPRPTVAKNFAADFLDPRMRDGRRGPLTHTALGMLVEIWHWYTRHKDECGPAFSPICNAVEEFLRSECPDALKELRKIAKQPDLTKPEA